MDANTLIASAMRLIGALDSGEVPSADEANDALNILNDMLDSWNAERLMAFSIAIQEFPLVSNKQVYTYGPGGDFNTTRPARIERTSVVSLTNPAQPQELPIDYFSDQDWQSVPVKVGITTTLPQGVYDDGSYPLRNISVLFTPSTISNLRFYVWQALNQFPDLVTDLTFPPGYKEALRYNLAQRMIAEWPGDYNPTMAAVTAPLAVESLARIRAMNMPIIQASVDPALLGDGGHYDWRSDTIVGRNS